MELYMMKWFQSAAFSVREKKTVKKDTSNICQSHLIQRCIDTASKWHIFPCDNNYMFRYKCIGSNNTFSNIPHHTFTHLDTESISTRLQITFLPARLFPSFQARARYCCCCGCSLCLVMRTSDEEESSISTSSSSEVARNENKTKN